MGKSQKPLRILVLDPCVGWDEWGTLREQGHTIDFSSNDYDVIVGERCWLMDEAHRKYLPLALAAARKRRYPKEPREQSE